MEVDPKSAWWKVCNSPNLDSRFDYSWAHLGLSIQRLYGGALVRTAKANGHIKPDSSLSKLIGDFEGAFPELSLVMEEADCHGSDNEINYTYVYPHGAIQINFDGDTRIYCNFISNDKAYVDSTRAFFEKNLDKEIPKGRVNVIVSKESGLFFKSLGIGGVSLERGNYEEAVLKGYDRVVSDLNSSIPAGRISIFNGPPGSGKSFLIRGILDEAKNSTFVLVPPDMVSQLGQPGTIPVLLKLKQDMGEHPIIFIIEDGDDVLATRYASNMSAVASLLNLGDGILGNLLDIRIITTTNSKHHEMDAALIRPGRLSAAIEVGCLTPEKATEVYRRLKGADAKEMVKRMTLAEVYSLARDEGWVPAKIERSLGFSYNEYGTEGDTVEFIVSRR